VPHVRGQRRPDLPLERELPPPDPDDELPREKPDDELPREKLDDEPPRENPEDRPDEKLRTESEKLLDPRE
jgi:hypothetical protein